MRADGGSMRFLERMRIRDKIFVGYLLAVLAVVGVACVSWQYLFATDRRFEQVVGQDVPRIRVLEHLRDKAVALIHAVDVFASRTAVNRLRTDAPDSLAAERMAVRDAERELAGFLVAFAGDLRAERVAAADTRNRILAAGNAILSAPTNLPAPLP